MKKYEVIDVDLNFFEIQFFEGESIDEVIDLYFVQFLENFDNGDEFEEFKDVIMSSKIEQDEGVMMKKVCGLIIVKELKKNS